MRRLILTLSAIALFGSIVTAEIRAPRIGIVRQLDGKMRPVYGITANLICGKAWDTQSVSAASFSDQAGLVLAGNRLVLESLDGTILGSVQISESNPLLAIESSPATAAAWLPSSGKLLIWDGQSFVQTRLDVASLPGKPTEFAEPARTVSNSCWIRRMAAPHALWYRPARARSSHSRHCPASASLHLPRALQWLGKIIIN